jgi:p-aminobenzoyl-glutamate transporter AbgT
MNEKVADLESSTAKTAATKRSASQRMLDAIERIGNKVPHPVMIFLGLIGLVIVLSAIFAAIGVSVTYEVEVPRPVPAEQTYPGGSHEQTVETPPVVDIP